MEGERLRQLREVLILFTLFVVPGLISAGTGSLPLSGGAPALAMTVRNVAFILLLLYLTDLSGDAGKVMGQLTGTLPTGALITVSLFLLAAATTTLLDVFDAGNTLSLRGAVTPGTVIFLFSVAAVEEMFFRGYLLLRLHQISGSFRKSLVAAALLFAVGHGYQGAGGLVFSFSAALFLGILWKRRPNFVAFALGHGLYNLLALVLVT
jgi:membrane protease YdiL (CAAX protease family)